MDREPTQAMLEAGDKAWGETNQTDDIEIIKIIWAAMVEEMLKND